MTSPTRKTITYYLYFPTGLQIGSTVKLVGRKLPVATSFAINFRKDRGEYDDIALSFNPRNDLKKVVMKSFLGRNWKNEVSLDNIAPLVDDNKDFTVEFTVKDGYYDIHVNGCTYSQFQHVIPPKQVQYLQLAAGAEYSEIDIQDNN